MKESTKEKLAVASTFLRLAQGLDLARRVNKGKPVIAATLGVMAVDLLDGIILRRLGLDGPSRRAADSATDAGIIAMGLAATYKKHPQSRPYVASLAAREVVIGAGWAVDLARSRQVKKGDDFHKLPSIAIAAFCTAAHHGSDRSMRNTGRAALAVNLWLGYDYLKAWSDPSRTRMLDNGVAEVPGFHDARVFIDSIKNAPL